jgi:hypothetical protein
VSRRELDGLDLGRAVGGHVAGAGAIARDREEENEISRVTVSVTQGFVPGDFFGCVGPLSGLKSLTDFVLSGANRNGRIPSKFSPFGPNAKSMELRGPAVGVVGQQRCWRAGVGRGCGADRAGTRMLPLRRGVWMSSRWHCGRGE